MSVVIVSVPPRAPLPPCALMVTTTPFRGLFPLSVNCTVTAPMAAPAVVLAGCVTKARFDAPAARLVSANAAVPLSPDALAVTEYVPAMLLAVAFTLTCPPASLTADWADNAADAPVPGAAKSTVMPLTGFPSESVTVACSVLVKAVLMVALCGVPAVA